MKGVIDGIIITQHISLNRTVGFGSCMFQHVPILVSPCLNVQTYTHTRTHTKYTKLSKPKELFEAPYSHTHTHNHNWLNCSYEKLRWPILSPPGDNLLNASVKLNTLVINTESQSVSWLIAEHCISPLFQVKDFTEPIFLHTRMSHSSLQHLRRRKCTRSGRLITVKLECTSRMLH